jgi:isoleucyl-tRNA synthetase
MNLPQTAFPMRAGLAKSEPLRLRKWQELDVYHQLLAQNQGQPSYILHDGPPYANGPLHMGHAFNKVLKDIIVRYKSQCGFYAPFVPGWDCHGQPIEHMVEATLGPKKTAAIDQVTLRRLCREWAEKYVNIQRAGFVRLGVMGEWDDPYLTYAPTYEAGNVQVFQQLYEAGAIYHGRKPIHWCPHCHTALAEAEIEYADIESPAIYVAFKIVSDDALAARLLASQPASGADILANLSILIWTTTPWTLPANSAVALSATADYLLIKAAGRYLFLAEELLEQVFQDIELPDYQLVRDAKGEPLSFKGGDLVGMRYHHPILAGLFGQVVTGAHVDLSTGTGAVHTAPGHGLEDYQVGLEYDLPLLMPVDDNGVFDAGGGPFAGMDVRSANPHIIKWLSQRGTLLGYRPLTHAYPHCWRCHHPVIFRATFQWFVSMDATGLLAKALAATGTIGWYPSWAVNRMRAMLEGRPDWCISRQRSWGVPIPVFTCSHCGQTVADSTTFAAVIALFEREGSDGWFKYAPYEYLPASVHCQNCGADARALTPDKDILDVWWESGVSHTSVLRERDYLSAPADLYLEGSDQHRGWFQSALLTSVGAYGVAPYHAIMSCGFIVDGQGYKMSKSRGNIIAPDQIIEEFGADVLRLWVGSIDYGTDASIDAEILQRSAEAYRRIRNSFRFLLSNLYDFDSNINTLDYDDLLALDRWALARLAELLTKVNDAYASFRFHVAYHAIYDYIVKDLSAIYLDALKDRLYSEAAASPRRRSAQTVLANILEALARVLAPILCFTCDEVWENYPLGMRNGGQLQADSQMSANSHAPIAGDQTLADRRAQAVVLAGWCTPEQLRPAVSVDNAEALSADFVLVLAAREAVNRALEQARGAGVIGKSQEACVLISAADEVIQTLKKQEAGLLEELLIVAEVKLRPFDAAESMQAAHDDAPPACSCAAPSQDAGADTEKPRDLGADTTPSQDAGTDTYSDSSAVIGAHTAVLTVSRAPGQKCARCWNIRTLGSDPDYPDLCARCVAVLRQL